MISLLLRNILFTILQPGLVAGLIPYIILSRGHINFDWTVVSWSHAAGFLFFIPGFCVMLHCISYFAVKGRGTLSPADPTKKLVTSGLYRYSRNPMYIGVLMMLLGEAMFFTSLMLVAYTMCIFAVFHVFIRFFEEPRLLKAFGNEYLLYQKQVRRWL